ncbi:LOW QUALITY PROTEIN: Hypothetical protein PHPALM_15713 [Phytophthora palmivora]|uniref:Ankyrin repeat-containing domain n=1 Tax=Phytophthora palmivora TaxID=4796 RepID=A0A2P4XRJ3_9STRA|nr:LOW QUALITY PROTEIN: Hypothetical protein PHPALM_15713 [Phytophthora palmivora]
MFYVAAERGCLDTVSWFVETFPGMNWPLSPAALGSNLNVVKWLHEHANGNAVQLNPPFQLYNTLTFKLCLHLRRCSDKEEGFKAVVWKIGDRRASSPTDAMYSALGGHLDVLQWLDANTNEEHSEDASAAKAGNLQVLLWLNALLSGLPERWICGRVPECGHLEVVKWHHENRSEECTVAVMNGAAKCGLLDVVKWLHADTLAGCTTLAMDWAAEWGHLEMVKWLHQNRTEGCITTAVGHDAAGGCLDVNKFLYANRTEGGLQWHSQMRANINKSRFCVGSMTRTSTFPFQEKRNLNLSSRMSGMDDLS